jgi:hypothetical protein
VDLRDFIVTPFIILAVYALAYYLRLRLCNKDNYKYFFPALTVKIVAALAVGLLYQFYYEGGDTFNYHTHGSRIIWETIFEKPSDGLKLLFGSNEPRLYGYASKIVFYHDPSSMTVVRIASIIDLVTFSSYSGTAVIFAFLSFIGLWYLFLAFYEILPTYKHRIAIATLFIPSVIFWGSGILKDTAVIGCLGAITYMARKIFIDKQISLTRIIVLVVAAIIIFQMKKYVLLCFIPALLLWVYYNNFRMIRSAVVRVLLLPLVLLIVGLSGFYAAKKIGENDPRYALDQIAETARVTAYDIGFYTGKNAGSTYSLGEQDGSFVGLLALFPQAVNVSLFRPYLWEARNVLMILSALEATVLLIFTLWVILRNPLALVRALNDPNIMFCLIFSVTFAFAVGVSTYNFGTLTRYRIPLLPFYLMALLIVDDKSRKRSPDHSTIYES